MIAHLFDLRPEEMRPTFLLFFYFFLITFSAYIIKPVKISLFLKGPGPEKLPYAYLLTALLIGFVVSLNSRLLQVMKRQVYISLSIIFFISNLVLFWIFFKKQVPGLSIIYWFWSDIFTATSVTQFWILVNDIYHPRQAKRLVGFLVSGGLLGGIGGALVASFLAGGIGTENLLLICPFLLGLCLLIVNRVRIIPSAERNTAREEQSTKKVKLRTSFQAFRRNRHLLLLAGIVLASIVVTTLVDFQFNVVVNTTYEGTDIRTAFLGRFFLALLVFSYLLHIFLTNRILKNFGIRTALLIAPVVLLVGSIAVLFIPAAFVIYWACSIKGADKSLAHSLNQSVREILYIPVAPEVKYTAKVFIDMFINKIAKGLAALVLLLFFTIFHFSLKEISLITVFFILVWMLLNILITKEYVNIVKTNLKIKWQNADKFIREKIDIDMTKLVFETLQSKNRSSVLYAMNLFDLIKKDKWSPELEEVISCKSDEIMADSMSSLLDLDGESLFPSTDEVLEGGELGRQVEEIMSLDIYQEVMQKHVDKILQEKRADSETARMEIAKALGLMDAGSSLTLRLKELLKDRSSDVVTYAIESAARLKNREFVPLIIPRLNDNALYWTARYTLIEYGAGIVGILSDYLADDQVPLEVRKSIPGILEKIGSVKVPRLLARELKKNVPDLESSLIEAMYKLKSEKPDVIFPEGTVKDKIIDLMKKSYSIICEIHNLISDEKKAFLAKELENNLARKLKHIFELLSLVYAHEEVIRAYQNICTGQKKSIDYSLELLDNILPKVVKEALFPLVEEIPLEEKVKRCRRMQKILDKSGGP